MRNSLFKIGFVLTLLILAAVNVYDYFRQRQEYHRFLEETGWVWAGHWTWGIPFTMRLEGLGFDNHSMVAPGGLALNIIFFIALAGAVGIACDYFGNKLLNK